MTTTLKTIIEYVVLTLIVIVAVRFFTSGDVHPRDRQVSPDGFTSPNAGYLAINANVGRTSV
jgi:hypothetical protein